MTRTGFDRRDLAAIAVGGLIGASLRWSVLRVFGTGNALAFESEPRTSTWFAYSDYRTVVHGFDFPWATLVANATGCLLLGAVMVLRTGRSGPARVWLAAAVGLCGSLTTFSTFAVDVAQRLQTRRLLVGPDGPVDGAAALVSLASGPPPLQQAIVYIAVSIMGGGCAFWCGRSIGSRFVSPRIQQ